MTSTWDNFIEKIKNKKITERELIHLINFLHDFDHKNKEVLAREYKKLEEKTWKKN